VEGKIHTNKKKKIKIREYSQENTRNTSIPQE